MAKKSLGEQLLVASITTIIVGLFGGVVLMWLLDIAWHHFGVSPFGYWECAIACLLGSSLYNVITITPDSQS